MKLNKYLREKGAKKKLISVITLKEVIEKNTERLNNNGVLKIDVEGFECEVLEGMDFSLWKPTLIVIESDPFSHHEQWEYILNNAEYKGLFYYGGSRYYIDLEKEHLFNNTPTVEMLTEKYDIFVPYQRLEQLRMAYEQSSSWKLTKIFRQIKNKFR